MVNDKTILALRDYANNLQAFLNSLTEEAGVRIGTVYDEVIQGALQAQKKAATYKTTVGAAVMMTDGKIFDGSNLENLSRALDMHAEKMAVAKAIQAGYDRHDFQALVLVYGDKPITDYAYPMCGICRQFAWENCNPRMLVIVVQPDGEVKFAGPLFLLYPLPYPKEPPARLGIDS